MTDEELLIVLYWQSAATLFLGIDYFIPNKIIAYFNKMLVRYFNDVKENIKYEMVISLKDFKKNVSELKMATVSIIFGIFIFYLVHIVGQYFPITSIIFIILSIFFLFIGIVLMFAIIFDLIKTLGFATPFILLILGIIHSPKGPLGAAGVGCFLISLAVQYSYISA